MFSKSKDAAQPAPSITAAPQNAAKRAPGRSAAPSIISADLTVTGTLVSNGDIQIDGVVDGDVRSVGLVIGEKAEIHGEILADDITVRGRVIGRDQGLFLVRIAAGVVRVNAGAWPGPEPRDAKASLEILAARRQENGRQIFLAREIRTASGTVVLRDTQGVPLPR